MTVLLTNNVSTTLAASIAAGDATFNVVDGNRFPSPTTGQYAYATIIAPNGAVEIVKITSRIGNALGVARAQEGTTAQVFPAGSRVELRVTAATVLDAVADGVAEFDADIAALDLRLDTAESDITALEGRMTTAESDIVSLDARLDIAEPEIDVLQAFDTTLGTSAGSNSVGFLQAGTGASSRTVQSKLRDFISVKDFGAVGDGVANDTAAIQAAINAAATLNKAEVYFPAGIYLVTTLYDYYDAVNNPNFPNGNYLAGRITLKGSGCPAIADLLYTSGPYRGTVIKTSSATGPALSLGNGVAAAAGTARRVTVKDIGFIGTCTNTVIDCNAAEEQILLDNLAIYNKLGANGIGLYVRGGSYLSKFSRLTVASDGANGKGIVSLAGGADLYEHVDVTNCGSTAWTIGSGTGFGAGSTFINCQAHNSPRGLEMNGARAVTLIGWWFEKNTEYDLKIRGQSTLINISGCLFISDTITTGNSSIILGDNTGTADVDACRNVRFDTCSFYFVEQTGILKYGTCTNAVFNQCDFKNNGGAAFVINTAAGVTPTELTYPDWYPFGAASALPDINKVQNQSGTQSLHLVRGTGVSQTLTPVSAKTITGAANNGAGLIRITSVAHGLVTGDYVNISAVVGTTEANGNWSITQITADTFDLVGSTFTNAYVSGGTVQKFVLDMRSWTHMPDAITVTTSVNGFIAMPTNAPSMIGKVFSVRKNLGGNTLTVVAGNIDGATSVSITADQATINLLATSQNSYTRL